MAQCVEVLSGPVCVEVLSGPVCVCGGIEWTSVCVCGGIEWTSVCGGIDLLAHCTVVVNSTDKTNTELLTKAP